MAQRLSSEPADVYKRQVLYYAPGYHDLSAQAPVQLASGQTVYLAGGAVVRGRFLAVSYTHLAAILGRCSVLRTSALIRKCSTAA